ncbi:AraC-type DNA-binding protein [Paenibacillus sp. UNCCL117]|uniref:helix-turn-helix transcriptional regulator n=1 Tax=unclassified Paenibacillus TaxID=185978 RepID=UPI000883A260|nr:MULTISPECIES: AraC family transcriptional regulator [unclassified Paenibacillus]SDE41186.1 AraC-type DNA-binding protein [Paenibacillus sp. cl123]SFW65447.1 AraC-type DNA-binding protein [Paenibacillus sp. UNCCL117]
MTNDRYSEIDGVISYIHESISEPLLLARLADIAGYSPYHFTRIFKERVGLPPLYYVSSLRLQRAKDLLLRTNLSIRDISLEVGQQSLGTFTSRFTERVGVTPSQFRQSARQTDDHLHSLKGLSDWQSLQGTSHAHGRVEGTIEAEIPFEGFILLGLFAKPIPEGLPLYGTLLSSLGRFSLSGVKPGVYYLMATSITWGMQAMDVLLPQHTLRTRSKEPLVVTPYAALPPQRVMLHPPRLDDPPILISLPLLMNNFLNRVGVH